MWLLPVVVIAAGMLSTLDVARHIYDETFFNGDLGVKFVQMLQAKEGYLGNEVLPPDVPWVVEAWDAGFAPIHEPFVYHEGGKRLGQYVALFPIISAPFYEQFGFRGLIILPTLAAWITWMFFGVLCGRRGVGPIATAVVLTGLIFASHLTIYASMFWEHTLGVMLGFFGVAALLLPGDRKWSATVNALAGLCLGGALWFRPEAICLLPAAAVCSAWIAWRRQAWSLWLVYMACAGFAALTFFAYNWITFDHPLGVTHRNLTRDRTQDVDTVSTTVKQFRVIYSGYVRFVPACVLAAAAPLFVWRQRSRFMEQFGPLYVFVLLLSLTIALVTPFAGKEIGPRYMLLDVPFAFLVLAMTWRLLRETPQRSALGAFVFLLCAAMAWGTWINHERGRKGYTGEMRRRVRPMLIEIRKQPHDVLLASHQHPLQELASLWQEKILLRAETPEKLTRLAPDLVAAGHQRFLWTGFDHREVSAWFGEERERVNVPLPGYGLAQFERIKSAGWMVLYEVTLQPSP